MKTTKLICRSIVAACLCLGMAACGDNDGTNPGGGDGEGGEQGEVLFAEGNGIADDGPNSREKKLERWDLPSDFYFIDYDDQGRPKYVHNVNEEYNFYYNAYELDGEVYRGIAVSNEEDKLLWSFDLNNDYLIESAYFKRYGGTEITSQYTFEYDDNRQLVHATALFNDYSSTTNDFYTTWKNGNIATVKTEYRRSLPTTYTTYEKDITYSDEPSWKAIITDLGYVAGGGEGSDNAIFYLVNLTGYFGKRPKNIPDEIEVKNQAGRVTQTSRYVIEDGSPYVEKDEDGYYTAYAIEGYNKNSTVPSRTIYEFWWK